HNPDAELPRTDFGGPRSMGRHHATVDRRSGGSLGAPAPGRARHSAGGPHHLPPRVASPAPDPVTGAVPTTALPTTAALRTTALPTATPETTALATAAPATTALPAARPGPSPTPRLSASRAAGWFEPDPPTIRFRLP